MSSWWCIELDLGPGGGHWPRKGVWGCAALKTPFSPLSCSSSQGSHFKQIESVHKTPFWENLEILASAASTVTNFHSQAPKFGNFQLTKPQIWKFSVHKPQNLEKFSSQAPPLSEENISSQAPHFGNLSRTPLSEKQKLSAPPAPGI